MVAMSTSTEMPYANRWAAMVALFTANFMNVLDATIVTVAIPTIERDLGATSTQIEWITAVYILAFALGLLPFGRLGDIVGAKRLFLLGAAAFTVASVLCGVAPNIESLIPARVAQGLGAAAMTPQVLAIVHVVFPPHEKRRVFSLFGVVSSLGSVLGPILGGLIVTSNFWGMEWRPIFLINAPIGLLVILLGMAVVPTTPSDRSIRNDWIGIALFAFATAALVFPLIEGRTYEWPVWIFGLVAISLVTALLFYIWERLRASGAKAQLLPTSLLHNPSFSFGAILTMGLFSGIPGLFLMLAIVLQSGLGMSPLMSGLAMAPFPVGILVASWLGRSLRPQVTRLGVSIGSIALALAMLVLYWVFARQSASLTPLSFAVPLGLAGLGTGIAIAALFQSTLSTVAPHEAGSASGALQTFQQIGSAVGIAIVGQLFFSSLEGSAVLDSDAFIGAAIASLWYQIGIFALVAAGGSLFSRQTSPN